MKHVSEAVDLIYIQIRPWRENPMPVHENRIMIKIENVNDSEKLYINMRIMSSSLSNTIHNWM